MKGITVTTLSPTATKQARLKVSAYDSGVKPLTVGLNNAQYWGESLDCREEADKAEALATIFLREHLLWDLDKKYRLVGCTISATQRVFVLTLRL